MLIRVLSFGVTHLNRAFVLYRSTIGKKAIMAVTGLIGFGFVIGHMLGNLQVFLGPEAFNAYADLLRRIHGLLWVARLTLLAAVILHIWAAYQLTTTSWVSRPIGYTDWKPTGSTYASRTMRWSGPILGLFLIYHLLDFTFGKMNPDFIAGDVYHNVIASFQFWYISAFYITAMMALGLHLYHGIWSMFQSLGINNPKYNALLRRFSALATVLIVIGFISVPIAVLTRYVS